MGKLIALLLLALVLGGVGFALYDHFQKSRDSPMRSDADMAPEKRKPPALLEMDLLAAAQRSDLLLRFKGNGREKLDLEVSNSLESTVKFAIPAGTLMTTENLVSAIVVTHAVEVVVNAGERSTYRLRSAAVRMENALEEQIFYPSEQRLLPVDGFLPILDQFPEASPETVQTAILILLHDPPLPVFARFRLLATEAVSLPNPVTHFQVDVSDILLALLLLKDHPEAPQPPRIALSQQLKLEAMINARSHDLALQYYDIDRSLEWEFWRTELQHGNPSTRHYALYGIARYYPDIAFKMLPSWIEEPRTPQPYRVHAAYALAEVENDEVLRKLTDLKGRLRSDSEMLKVINRALDIAQKKALQHSQRTPSPPLPASH